MLPSLFYRGSIEIMDDSSWKYQDSTQGLWRIDYYNGVQGFTNFATSIPKNFSGGDIRCPYRKCKNKKYLPLIIITIHLLHKGFMKNYLCWYVHGEIFVRNESMVKRMVGSTSSASNVHEIGNDNSNPYRNMVMDAIWSPSLVLKVVFHSSPSFILIWW